MTLTYEWLNRTWPDFVHIMPVDIGCIVGTYKCRSLYGTTAQKYKNSFNSVILGLRQ